MTHGVNNAKDPPITSLYLNDVPELPDHPDPGVTTNGMDFTPGFQKYMIYTEYSQ